MFKLIGQIASTLGRTVTMIDHLAEAGECQTLIIRDSSRFDVEKKRLTLNAEIKAFKSQTKTK